MTYKSRSKQKFGGVKTEKSPISHCGKEVKDCINYFTKCRTCIQIKGVYSNYEKDTSKES